LTVAENVALPLIVQGVEENEAVKKSIALLDQMHLAHRSKVSPASLSKGQQQRVAIARAMVSGANIIICDEPTSALDHTAGYEIMDFLHSLAKDSSKAVVVVTHDPRIFSYADRIIEMCDGEISLKVDK
jgi:putative ABC transport system ATP-binding protein